MVGLPSLEAMGLSKSSMGESRPGMASILSFVPGELEVINLASVYPSVFSVIYPLFVPKV